MNHLDRHEPSADVRDADCCLRVFDIVEQIESAADIAVAVRLLSWRRLRSALTLRCSRATSVTT